MLCYIISKTEKWTDFCEAHIISIIIIFLSSFY